MKWFTDLCLRAAEYVSKKLWLKLVLLVLLILFILFHPFGYHNRYAGTTQGPR
jgi:hypothetical protein